VTCSSQMTVEDLLCIKQRIKHHTNSSPEINGSVRPLENSNIIVYMFAGSRKLYLLYYNLLLLVIRSCGITSCIVKGFMKHLRYRPVFSTGH